MPQSTDPKIQSLLGRLSGRIRWYVFLEGLLSVIALAAGLFWLIFLIDWFYFKVWTLELPVAFRMFYVIASLCLIVLSIFGWIFFRLLKRMRLKALALVLERRFPQLNDRLITAVEEEASPNSTPLTEAMLRRTIDDVKKVIDDLDVADVFNPVPLRRVTVLAVIAVTSIAGLWVTNASAMERIYNALFKMQQVYIDRETYLVVKVVVQPGDQVREFEQGLYKHPRGGDLTLLVEAPEQTPAGQPNVLPDLVRLQYRYSDGSGAGRAICTQVSDRQFKYTMAGVLDSLDLWVQGGDFRNLEPYRVLVVDPPRVDQIVLNCDYPAYTKLADDGADSITVQGTQIALPMETAFLMHGLCNKPLVELRLPFGDRELVISRNGDDSAGAEEGAPLVSARIKNIVSGGTAEKDQPIPEQYAARMLSADGREFSIPFLISETTDPDRIANRTREYADYGQAVVIPAETQLRLYLEDTDNIISSEPTRLLISGIIDEPPVVETHRKGISSIITRKARIPIEGLISDDYGLENVRFDFKVDNEEAWRPRGFFNKLRSGTQEFNLQRTNEEPFERFDVLPLGLQVGQQLTLSVYAVDQDNLNGPHETRGEQYQFKIVTDEELISLLNSREFNLHTQFAQIISEIEQLRASLVQQAKDLQQVQERSQSQNDEEIEKRNVQLSSASERNLHQLGKNQNETEAIEESFRSIMEELDNNQILTPEMKRHLDDLIVNPLSSINNKDYPGVDNEFRLYRDALSRSLNAQPALQQGIANVDNMLTHMKTVLAEIKDLADFHKALQELGNIVKKQVEIKNKTKEQRAKDLFDDNSDLFKDDQNKEGGLFK